MTSSNNPWHDNHSNQSPPVSAFSDDNPFRTAQLPSVSSPRSSGRTILIAVLAVMCTFLLSGFIGLLGWILTRDDDHVNSDPTVVTSWLESPESEASTTSNIITSSPSANPQEVQAATGAGLTATGFSTLSCLGTDTWVFAAVSTDNHHVLICQSGTSDSHYYTHDYMADVYRKDVNEYNTATGQFKVYNDDATIVIHPGGLTVYANQGSDFSSTFSKSFVSNPWR